MREVSARAEWGEKACQYEMAMTYDFRVVENSDGFRDTLAEDRGHGAVQIAIGGGTEP